MQKVESPQKNFAARAALNARSREEVAQSALLIGTVLDALSKTTGTLAAGDLEKLNSIGEIPDREEFFHSLLHFGVQLKQDRRLDQASVVLGLLTSSEAIPPAIKAQAVRELDAIAGKGSIGMRIEVLTGQFAEDATHPRVIGPMLGASVVGRLVGTAALSRLAVSPNVGWLTRGFGAKFAAGTVGYLAEFPSFALLNRAAALHPEAGIGDEMKRAAITIGALKIFGYAGNQGFLKLHGFNEFGVPARLGGIARFNQAALPQVSMFSGLLAAHRVEVGLGLRPNVDGATTVTDTLASLVSLGVGSHLGHRVLGPGFAGFQSELALRTRDPSPAPPGAPSPARGEGKNWVLATGVFQGSKSGIPSPLAVEGGRRPGEGPVWMAMSEDSSGGGRKAPLYTKESYVEHGLTTYRDLAGDSFMGDPIKNIRERLKKNPDAVRILDIGSGNGVAVKEIKERFKAQVQVETNDLDPISLYYIDRHHQGDFLQTSFEGRYDLMFSIYGAHAYHEGKLIEMLQKSAELLRPGGEFFASLTHESIHQPNFFQPLNGFKNLSKVLRAMDQGLLVRYEEVPGGAAIYLKRLNKVPLPSIRRILDTPTLKLTEPSRRILQEQIAAKLVASRVKTMGATLDLGYPYAEFTADLWSRLGVREFTAHPVKWVRRLFENYLQRFQARHSRPPNAHDIGRWVSGDEPSALAREPLLFDELLRIKMADLEKKAVLQAKPAWNPTPRKEAFLDRARVKIINQFHEKVIQLPQAHPGRDALNQEVKDLYSKAAEKPDEAFLFSEIARLEATLDLTWLELYRRAAATFGPILQSGGRKLRGEIPKAAEAKQRVEELSGQFLDNVMETAKRSWEGLSDRPFPYYLRETLESGCRALLHLNLLGQGLDPKTLGDFVGEVTRFFYDFPGPLEAPTLQLIPEEARPTAHNFLLGSSPNAAQFLGTIAANLRGYRRLFGPDAGRIFHRQTRLVSELRGADGKPTDYLLVLEKGHLEFETGLMLALFKRSDFEYNSHNHLGKVGINLANDGSLRIVNIQGPYPTVFRDPASLPDLKPLLGGAEPLDMLVATAILLGRNAGFEKVEGIRDGAQIARAEHSMRKAKHTGYYDLFFRKFGFKPPAKGSDYWKLNLKEMEIHRSDPLLAHELLWKEAERRTGDVEAHADPNFLSRLSDLERLLMDTGTIKENWEALLRERVDGRHLPALGVLNPGNYFRQVLIRQTRDESGRRLRPVAWDRQGPSPLAGPVRAFWKVMAPTFSALEWQSLDHFGMDGWIPHAQRPFRLRNLQPEAFPNPPDFYQASLQKWDPAKTPLEPRYRQEFFATLQRAHRGRLSPERAELNLKEILQADWIAKLQREGAEVARLPLREFFSRLKSDLTKSPSWIGSALQDPSLTREPVLQIEIDPHAYGSIHHKDSRGFGFAVEVLRLIAEEIGLPKEAFARKHSDGSWTLLLPAPSFFLRLPRLIHGDRAMGRKATHDIDPDTSVALEKLRILMEQDQRPALLSIFPLNIHESPKTHPFFAFMHDVYHIYKLNKLSPETRKDLVRLYDAFIATKSVSDVDRELKRYVVEQILDGNPDPEGEGQYRPLWNLVRGYWPSVEFLGELRRNLEIQFGGNPRLKTILKDFDEALKRPTGPGGGFGPKGSAGAMALLLGVGTTLALLTSSEPALAAGREGGLQPKGWEIPLSDALMMSWFGGLTLRQLLRALAESWWDSFLRGIGIRKFPSLPDANPPQLRAISEAEGESSEIPKSVPTIQVLTDPADSKTDTESKTAPAIPMEEWLKGHKKRLAETLSQPKLDMEEKKWAVQVFLKELDRVKLDSARVVEAMQLVWELGFNHRLDEETREWALYDYVGYLRNPAFFPPNSPQVYREAMRLRRIFSKSREENSKRLQAVDGYNQLIGKFDTNNTIARGEAAMGQDALQTLYRDTKVKADMRARVKIKGALGMLTSKFPHLKREEE